MQSANYVNCNQTDQGDYMTGMTKLTGVIRLTSDQGDHWSLTRLTGVTRLTRQIFPPDRIRDGWCENCQTCEIANL